MRFQRTIFAGFALLGAAPLAAQAPGNDSAVPELNCDRECLLGFLGQYMDALAQRDPAAVPATSDIMFTENNVTINLGEGLWGTVSDVDEVGLEVADALTGNAVWFGSVRENGKSAMFAARIHVKNGLIDETESVVVRRMNLAAPTRDKGKLEHDPAFYKILTPQQRRPRERMIAIADSYFDTVELNDGQVFAPFATDCGRLENGISTTAKSDQTFGGNAASIVEGCEAQFRLGIYRINKRIRERRYPIVDVERGVVVATGFFDHANEFDRYLLTDGSEMKTALKWPNTVNLLEAFRIRDAEIHRIEAVFTYAPYAIHSAFYGPDAATPVHAPVPDLCGDECLTQLTQQVMSAYVSKDWRSLPWAKQVGYSDENAGIQVGEGIWGTVTAIDAKPLIVADGQTGNAVWIGRIEEHGQPAWAAITVEGTVEDSELKIGAIHTLVHRKEYGPPWAQPETAPSFNTLPLSRQTSRAAMLAGVESFYAAMNSHDGSVPSELGEGCRWVVNGQDLSDCAAPLAGNHLQALARVRDVEVLAVDEARGLVITSTFEDFPANPQQFTDSSGKKYRDMAASPRTLKVVELFRFEGGRIQRVEAFTLQLPFGSDPR